MSTEDVEVRRSTRRRRTVSARREGGRVVVLIPASMSRAEERKWVERMLTKLKAGESRRRPSDDDLLRRAADLSERYLGGHARPRSIRWVSNQRSRWGSCTPADGSIRISDRLQGMPSYVVDYVILHELAHLLVAGHNRDFWTLLRSYPKLERARGFLDGVALARGLDIADDADEGDDDASVADATA
ncbi:metal-dependent hydrolase [Knoellia sinensis KCTC 19936]|uniref:Metal-dependent hydrolase n=1 Tax=Knoellia sinensis KCTC 19936 TaxID=1385520 RepID=A0A0A0JH45_9MICO|nr:M48 family metallopeptidase [Knoellia sinensis]KGN34951.1 metal-dependent hydrolase [Knoellia sinensis KCTC 19936]